MTKKIYEISVLKKWARYSIGSMIVGIFVGYAFGWIWFFFRLIILGYGDSGPEWIITVNKAVFLLGFFSCIIYGQMLFLKRSIPKKSL
jgi:formate/nitrite transporter FocA (FNT family)